MVEFAQFIFGLATKGFLLLVLFANLSSGRRW